MYKFVVLMTAVVPCVLAYPHLVLRHMFTLDHTNVVLKLNTTINFLKVLYIRSSSSLST